MRDISRAACFTFILFLVFVVKVKGRFIRSNVSDEILVSDGVDYGVQPNQDNSYLLLKGNIELSEKQCEEMYGFIPCSTSIYGLLTLIFMFEFMLYQGESFLAAGSKEMFQLQLGPVALGPSTSDILGALPESLVFVVSGLSGNKEVAQEYAMTGVGLLAGSSIFLLTLVWGICVFRGRQKLINDSTTKRLDGSILSLLASPKTSLTGFGIPTNLEIRKIAKFMVLSVIPPLIMQIPVHRNVCLIIAFIVATVLLILYVFSQTSEPGKHKDIRQEYLEHGHLVSTFLDHAPKHTLHSILTENGILNDSATRKLYAFLDKNGDGHISPSEMKELLLITRLTDETNINEENEVEELFKNFDTNHDGRLSYEEFRNGLKKWFKQTNQATKSKLLARKVLEVFLPSFENIRHKHNQKKHIESEILSRVTKDGTAVERFFKEIDSNGDNCISQSELIVLVRRTSPGLSPLDVEDLAEKIFGELDTDEDGKISWKEFVDGIQKWRNESSSSASQGQYFQVLRQSLKGLKALGNVLLGIVMLSFFAEPLISSVQKLSEYAGIPSLFISFFLVPLAINGREAALAISEASHKNSETFYEIYDAVSMNNILGFLSISILIYLRGVTWEFSAELLIVAIVCVMMGLAASFYSKFPLWTSILGCLLYPVSLGLVFVMNDVLNYV